MQDISLRNLLKLILPIYLTTTLTILTFTYGKGPAIPSTEIANAIENEVQIVPQEEWSQQELENQTTFRKNKALTLYKKAAKAVEEQCQANDYVFYHGMSYESSFLPEVFTAIGKKLGKIPAYSKNRTLLRIPLDERSGGHEPEPAIHKWTNDNSAQTHETCVQWLRSLLPSFTKLKKPNTKLKKPNVRYLTNETATPSEKEGWSETMAITAGLECYHERKQSTPAIKVGEALQLCLKDKKFEKLASTLSYYRSNYTKTAYRKLINEINKAENSPEGYGNKCTINAVFWDNYKNDDLISADINPSSPGRNESALFFLINNKGSQAIPHRNILRNAAKATVSPNLDDPTFDQHFNELYDGQNQEAGTAAGLAKDLDDLSELGRAEKIGVLQVLCVPKHSNPRPYYLSSAYGVPLQASDLIPAVTPLPLASTLAQNFELMTTTAQMLPNGITCPVDPSAASRSVASTASSYGTEYLELTDQLFLELKAGKRRIRPDKWFGYKDEGNLQHLFPQVRLTPKTFNMNEVKVITVTSLDAAGEAKLEKIRKHIMDGVKAFVNALSSHQPRARIGTVPTHVDPNHFDRPAP